MWLGSRKLCKLMFHVSDPEYLIFLIEEESWNTCISYRREKLEYLVFLIEEKSCSESKDENCCEEGESATKCVH